MYLKILTVPTPSCQADINLSSSQKTRSHCFLLKHLTRSCLLLLPCQLVSRQELSIPGSCCVKFVCIEVTCGWKFSICASSADTEVLRFSLKTGVPCLAQPLWQQGAAFWWREVSQIVVGGEGCFWKYKIAVHYWTQWRSTVWAAHHFLTENSIGTTFIPDL